MAATSQIGVDIGGTFTDAVAVSGSGIHLAKVPSNTQQPGQAVMDAVAALALADTPGRFLHGTTLVTNMLLECKGDPTGFITSSGMRDVIHIGRHERPQTYAVRQIIPQQHYPPVPRKWRHAVPERTSASGEVIIPLDERAVRQAARDLADAGVAAIGIGFLHAYHFPEHERQAARWVQEEAPDIFVCTSSEVSPRFREYERFLTTAWNARVAPGAAVYLSDLARQIDARWPGLRLTLMTSNGGLEEVNMRVQSAYGDLRRTPIRLSLSGPAAAGNAIVHVARDLGIENCVGLDIGGTSSDIVVVRDGRLRQAPWEERRVGGYPLQIPMLDLHSIGAGGGSLVYRDAFGAIHVGPESAGANPGPACYGQSGQQPTVTDAAVAAGRLPAQVFLGGQMSLHAHLARQSLEQTFGVSAGEAVANVALQVLRLAEANVAFAIRERTVARGLDPADLVLVAAGGAGPLLACGIAETLELAEVVVPPRPGLLAAWGLLVANDRREAVLTVLQPLAAVSAEQATAYFGRAEAALPDPRRHGAQLHLTAALRYLGQGFEVDVPVTDPADISGLARRFHQAHEREYGFALPEAQIEWVELLVAWEKPAPSWQFSDPVDDNVPEVEQVVLWELISGQETVRTNARVVQRRSLRSGDELTGPAIVIEIDATTYVPTGWQAEVAPGGYLRMKKR